MNSASRSGLFAPGMSTPSVPNGHVDDAMPIWIDASAPPLLSRASPDRTVRRTAWDSEFQAPLSGSPAGPRNADFQEKRS